MPRELRSKRQWCEGSKALFGGRDESLRDIVGFLYARRHGQRKARQLACERPNPSQNHRTASIVDANSLCRNAPRCKTAGSFLRILAMLALRGTLFFSCFDPDGGQP